MIILLKILAIKIKLDNDLTMNENMTKLFLYIMRNTCLQNSTRWKNRNKRWTKGNVTLTEKVNNTLRQKVQILVPYLTLKWFRAVPWWYILSTYIYFLEDKLLYPKGTIFAQFFSVTGIKVTTSFLPYCDIYLSEMTF